MSNDHDPDPPDERSDDDASDGWPPSADVEPSEVIAEISTGGAVPFDHLRALSQPPDETVGAFVALWPRLEPARRREVLAWLQQLAEEDATLDFHRIHLSALRDQDPATRILAVRGLWEQERIEYMHLLMDQLRDDLEATVRAAVADALHSWVVGSEFGMLSGDEADLLCSTLREVADDINEEDEVRGRALEALGASSEEWVAELISEAYETGSTRMRLAALRAMGSNANDEWLPVLIYNFDDDDPDIRAAAATSAGQLLLESAIDPLVALLEDDDEDVQVAAIHAIGEIAGDDAERVLTALLGRPERHLSDAAQEALAGARMLAAEFVDDEGEPR